MFRFVHVSTLTQDVLMKSDHNHIYAIKTLRRTRKSPEYSFWNCSLYLMEQTIPNSNFHIKTALDLLC